MTNTAYVGWTPQANRPGPIAILAAQAATRLPELLPLRYSRMRASPFAFLRGSAAIMAADLANMGAIMAADLANMGAIMAADLANTASDKAALSSPGPIVQLCGDAHLANFGAYASPEGNPVFDVNDFDETHPGPFDWDLRRLATSLVVSGREHGLSAKACRNLATRAAHHYRRHLKRLSGLPPLQAWHSTVDLRAAIAEIDHHKLRHRLERRLRAATEASQDHYGLIDAGPGAPRIVENANTRHLPDHDATIDAAFAAYPSTLQPQYADLAARYRLADRALKVVGIGSVGTFCAIGLFVSERGAPLLLQLKQAQPSCLAGAPTNADTKAGTCNGQRVVTGQRRLQAESDIFLGWTPHPIDGRDFYIRALKDTRLARIGDSIEAAALPFTAALCGRTLARAHGRAGDAARLHATIHQAAGDRSPRGPAFDAAIADFAVAYADQTELDHAAFCRALDDGRLGPPEV